jgi:hypothetical protein
MDKPVNLIQTPRLPTLTDSQARRQFADTIRMSIANILGIRPIDYDWTFQDKTDSSDMQFTILLAPDLAVRSAEVQAGLVQRFPHLKFEVKLIPSDIE